jgi:cytoskeletal protein CcmA (bactofilin family)
VAALTTTFILRIAMNISTKIRDIETIIEPIKGPTVVSIDLNIIGNLSAQGTLKIKGTVEGDINSEIVIIESGGLVKGRIHAHELFILGKFRGEIVADKVIITSSGHVSGELTYERLTIDDGAFLDVSFQKRI